MKKKKRVGGAAFRRKQGMKTVLVPLTTEQRDLVNRAARASDQSATRFAAAALVEAAENCLAKETSEKSEGAR